jgi:hypothetical protein
LRPKSGSGWAPALSLSNAHRVEELDRGLHVALRQSRGCRAPAEAESGQRQARLSEKGPSDHRERMLTRYHCSATAASASDGTAWSHRERV